MPPLQTLRSERPLFAHPRWWNSLDSLELEQPDKLQKLLKQGFPALEEFLNSQVEHQLQQELLAKQAGDSSSVPSNLNPSLEFRPLQERGRPLPPLLNPEGSKLLTEFRLLMRDKALSLPGAEPNQPSPPSSPQIEIT